MNKKKYFKYIVYVLCAGFLFAGCDEDDYGNGNGSGSSTVSVIRAKVENGNAYNSKVDEVRGIEIWYDATVATGSYANGGFTLNLPATVDNRYLHPIREVWLTRNDDFYDFAELSNTDAKMCNSMFIDAYKSGAMVGIFFYCDRDLARNLEKNIENGAEDIFRDIDKGIVTLYTYTDRDFSLTGYKSYGTGSYASYSAFLKKGWNKTYSKYSRTGNTSTYELTSKEPSGLKWYGFFY